ncbi:MAG: acyl-CoA thioesterase [Cytophagaceae bacterium]
MVSHEVQVRVRYAETDKMGYVYYGNYATYYEVARVEMMRALGLSYKKLEDSGVMMPVLEYKIKYIKPAFYDDLLTIKIFIKEKPGVKIKFDYECYNESGTLLNVGETTLVFVSAASGRPCSAPGEFDSVIAKYFEMKV